MEVTGYPLKSKSPTHRQEERSLQILSSVLNFDRVDIAHDGGVVVSIDGEITFLDKDGQRLVIEMGGQDMIAVTKYQVKSSYTAGKKKHKIDIEDIADYVLRPPHRAIVFFVDILLEKVYWEIIDSEYVRSVLKVLNLKKPGTKTKVITFYTHKELAARNTEPLYEDFANPKPAELESVRVSGTEVAIATEDELQEYKHTLSTVITGDIEKVLAMEALIFYHSPLDVTDESVMQSILSKSELTNTEYDFYTAKLLVAGIMTKVGDILSISDTKAAQALLNDLITKKGIKYIYG